MRDAAGILDGLQARRDGAVESAQALLIDVLTNLSAFAFRGDDALSANTAALPRLFGRFQRERGREVGEPLNASLELSGEEAAKAAGGDAEARVRAEPRPSTSFAAPGDDNGRAERARLQAAEPARATAISNGFESRLNLLAGPLLKGLDMTNLCIAGGAVLRALTMGNPLEKSEIEDARTGASDIDFFVVADDEQSARAAFDRLFAHLKARYALVPNKRCWLDDADDPQPLLEKDRGSHEDGEPPFRLPDDSMLVVRSKFAVTFAAGWRSGTSKSSCGATRAWPKSS